MILVVLGSITFGWREKSKLHFSVRNPGVKHSCPIFTIFLSLKKQNQQVKKCFRTEFEALLFPWAPLFEPLEELALSACWATKLLLGDAWFKDYSQNCPSWLLSCVMELGAYRLAAERAAWS